MGTRPLNKGTNRPITLCTVKLFVQLMYNKNDHLAKWSLCVRFVALRPKSTAMVIAGRSVHLTTLFPGQA